MKEVSDSLFESIDFVKEDLLNSPEEFLEIIKEIPVFKTVRGIYKLYGSINQYLFKKRVMLFLHELSSIDQKEREKFIERISKNDKDFGIKILRIIEKIDDEKISTHFNKWFKCYVQEKISLDQYNRGCNIIPKLFIDDLEYFLYTNNDEFELTGNSEEYPHEGLFPLINVGLLGYGNNPPEIINYWDRNEIKSTVTIWITEIGKCIKENLSS